MSYNILSDEFFDVYLEKTEWQISRKGALKFLLVVMLMTKLKKSLLKEFLDSGFSTQAVIYILNKVKTCEEFEEIKDYMSIDEITAIINITYIDEFEALIDNMYNLPSDNLNLEIIDVINRIAEHLSDNKKDYSVTKIISPIMNIQDGDKIYDPFIGFGSSLLGVNNIKKAKIYGTEINYEIYSLMKILFFVKNINSEDIFIKDAFDYFPKEKMDKVITEPPIGFKYNFDMEKYYEFKKNGIIKHTKIGTTFVEWAVVEYILASLSDNGIASILISTSSLIRASDKYIREIIVKEDIIEAIIELPKVSYSLAPSCILIINKNKNKDRKDRILYIDLNKCKNDEEVSDIVDNAYNKDSLKENICYYVSNDNIDKNEYNLYLSQLINKNITAKKIENSILLRDVAESIFRGSQTIKSGDNIEKNKHKAFLINISNIVDDEIITSDSDEVFVDSKVKVKFSAQKGDLLITSRGAFKSAIVRDEKDYIVSSNIIAIRLKKNKYNVEILKAYLDSRVGRELISNIQTGVTVTTVINARQVTEIPLPNIDIETQSAISNKIVNTKETYKKEIQIVNEKFSKEMSEIHRLMRI